MGSPLPAVPIAKPIHEAAADLCERIASEVTRVLPRGFRGRVEFVVDNGLVRAQDVSVSFRPRQDQAGQRRT